MTAAAAAGMVIGTSTVVAVLIYAGACWTWWARPVKKPAEPELAEVVSLPLRGAQPEAELDLAA
jgi:hypothetical protein